MYVYIYITGNESSDSVVKSSEQSTQTINVNEYVVEFNQNTAIHLNGIVHQPSHEHRSIYSNFMGIDIYNVWTFESI